MRTTTSGSGQNGWPPSPSPSPTKDLLTLHCCVFLTKENPKAISTSANERTNVRHFREKRSLTQLELVHRWMDGWLRRVRTNAHSTIPRLFRKAISPRDYGLCRKRRRISNSNNGGRDDVDDGGKKAPVMMD